MEKFDKALKIVRNTIPNCLIDITEGSRMFSVSISGKEILWFIFLDNTVIVEKFSYDVCIDYDNYNISYKKTKKRLYSGNLANENTFITVIKNHDIIGG